jgi:hypothetical protein
MNVQMRLFLQGSGEERRGTMKRRELVGRRLRAWVLGLAVLAVQMVLLTPALHANEAARAARLSSVEGQVRIVQGSTLLADPALVNTPLFEGMQVRTAEDGRAELEFDDGSIVRLAPNSLLTLKALRGQIGKGSAEVVLASGLGYFELQDESADSQIKVRFGGGVVTANGFSVLRINLDNPSGELAVFSGNAHLERGSAVALDLHGGESVTLNSSDPGQYVLAESIEPDSWDTWNSDREQEMTAAASARTGVADKQADRNNPAWNDLDANGNWYDVPDQGAVWSPYEAADPGWEPYGNGHWMWTPRFGYIWVSGASWGYLPFQCGAWDYFDDFGWGWAPGMCRPWWGGGVWISTIGHGPGGYRPPMRPRPVSPGSPHRPVGGPKQPLGPSPMSNGVVAVNRRPLSGTPGTAVRDRNSVVTIGGRPVQPLRPVAQRPQYLPSVSGQTMPGQMRQAYPSRPAHQGVGATAGQRPANGFVPGGSHPLNAPSIRPFGGGQPASAPSQRAPSYSRPSSGGGSSSPSHSSGGGGGGFHSSGGGGSSSSGGGSHSSSGGGSTHR